MEGGRKDVWFGSKHNLPLAGTSRVSISAVEDPVEDPVHTAVSK